MTSGWWTRKRQLAWFNIVEMDFRIRLSSIDIAKTNGGPPYYFNSFSRFGLNG
jgi:hypothetical protein